MYNVPAFGTPFVQRDKTVSNLYGPLPVGYIKLHEIGALLTLVGAEYTFTFENMNIERGLLWNQENAINRGIQVNQTIGKSASLSWNDGFYSNRRQSAADRGTAAGCRAHHRQACPGSKLCHLPDWRQSRTGS